MEGRGAGGGSTCKININNPKFKHAPQPPNLVLLYWYRNIQHSDATLKVSPNCSAPSSFTSKKCSPKHSLSHTLLLYCPQIRVGLQSVTLLATSQAQGPCPRFWKLSPTGFPRCLPNNRVMNTASGAGSKRTAIGDLGGRGGGGELSCFP